MTLPLRAITVIYKIDRVNFHFMLALKPVSLSTIAGTRPTEF